MAQLAVIEAVEGRLAEVWTASPIVGVLTPEADPHDGSPFLVVQYPVTNSDIASIGDPGNNLWRDEGVFLVRAYRPKGQLRQLVEDADTVGRIFRGWQSADGVLSCFAPEGASIDDRNDDGLFDVISVSIPYHFDHLG
ncbi:hypothetical protein [Methylopila sp. 73B]|uniref:hypothetical protein n=1 Tax=Methylopila sp. 73B TaxID=1120792 RepID=UPI0003639165|nr:hypothetical protein [Methylopila sp. 73B]